MRSCIEIRIIINNILFTLEFWFWKIKLFRYNTIYKRVLILIKNIKCYYYDRYLNLEKPTFNFPKPILIIKEDYQYTAPDKYMGMWEVGEL